jgi:thiamine phosphate synthase YjbQ (UPF0047 family)
VDMLEDKLYSMEEAAWHLENRALCAERRLAVMQKRLDSLGQWDGVSLPKRETVRAPDRVDTWYSVMNAKSKRRTGRHRG